VVAQVMTLLQLVASWRYISIYLDSDSTDCILVHLSSPCLFVSFLLDF
jgi:hypothetical protein